MYVVVNMKAFLIYSYDDSTLSYDLLGHEVNNCQVLGRGYGNNTDEAVADFIKKNNWLNDFYFKEIVVIEIYEQNSSYRTINLNHNQSSD